MVEEKVGIIMAGYTEGMYFEGIDEKTTREILDECRERGWCDEIGPVTNAKVLQTILDKNKPKGCRVKGISQIGDHTTTVFVGCDETVSDKEMCDWMNKSVDEVERKARYGSIKNFGIWIVDNVRKFCR